MIHHLGTKTHVHLERNSSPMRLFRPQEVENQKKDELIRLAQKKEDLSLWMKDELQKINLQKSSSEKEKEQIQKDLDSSMQLSLDKKNELDGEVKQLLLARQKLLEPITQIQQKTQADFEAVREMKGKIDLEVTQIRRDREELIQELFRLDEMKAELQFRELTVKDKEDSLRDQQQFVKQSSTMLMSQWEKFYEQQKKKEKEVEQKIKEVEDKKKSLAVLNLSAEKEWEKIRKEQRHITSQQTSLKLADKEMKKKYG